jgi:YD repeat-containing protein
LREREGRAGSCPRRRRIPVLGVAPVAAWGTPIAATTTTNYDNLGEVTSVTAPGGAVSRYGYDVLGRSVSATAAYGTSLARTTTTAYDTLGRMIAVTDPANKTTTTAYDDIARTVAVTDPLIGKKGTHLFFLDMAA